MKKKVIILIDGNSYLYRVYYARLKNTNKNILCFQVIYNILYIFKKILIQYKPKKFIIIFDSKKKNFRNKIFKNYKNNRPKMPDILKKISLKIKNILLNIGIPVIIIPKFEADDIIGTISKLAEKNGDYVLIGTCDKDLTQLVNKNIYILNNISNTILNSQDIYKKYGVNPNLMIDFLSLIGDQSDNIPGVLGIGKKTASILLNNIGCIKNIYNNIYKILSIKMKGRKNVIKKLYYGKKMAFLSYKLAKIKIDVKLNVKYKTLNLHSLFYPCTYDNYKYINIIYDIKNIIFNNI
ncbi:5'-3' exonuclease H3TH domain-containing protein [Buchnera aphidicola]|uniref:5'-3' exonuclease domain-containing protein n=1 Tax=Buchnera aphidicola (Therioaphis trifolii) TaxID=1241884 RepID=A0A4D6YDI3_9GAMM|nr:5'-3' exonuclease H3TH domain-containing protein [Buchnera aphidicola]QCI27269.1 hypothetical protein D9V81_01440 [Buchnera aphidicola (Therioaphis trifolii)]